MTAKEEQLKRIENYSKMLESQGVHAVRPYHTKDKLFREDGFVNVLNRYGTSNDTTEHYNFIREDDIPAQELVQFYEGNGLFARIIDTPAEEAVKHGFEFTDMEDKDVETFFRNSLDELDWDEMAMVAGKWSRLFGGSLVVMLIDDGRGLDEPLDWKNIHSIDELKVYDRSYIIPDYGSMYTYEPDDPFRMRRQSLGTPERYHIYSRYGSFTVHESRCLLFKNGAMPEHTTNINYHIWGISEYTRIQRAIRDSEVAHGSAVKMLDRSVQAVYKMNGLSQLLSSEEGEDIVIRRLQTIDMARGLLNSITIDNEGEEYDFRQFNYQGVAEIIDTTCEYLSALTNIPQTILFGRSPAGMNATGESDFENYYNYVERIQNRTLKSNLRYLLTVIAQAGVYTGEIEKVPNIRIEFSPLWSMTDAEKQQMEIQKAQLQQTKAAIAQTYISLGIISKEEVRKALYDKDELDFDTILDSQYDTLKEAMDNIPQDPQGGGGGGGDMAALLGGMGGGGGMPMQPEMQGGMGEANSNAPDMNALAEMANGVKQKDEPEKDEPNKDEPKKEKSKDENNEDSDIDSYDTPKSSTLYKSCGSVGVIVVSDGKILCGERKGGKDEGLLCGPGGHIHIGETSEQAARRETQEEFGITPKNLLFIGYGNREYSEGYVPHIYLCTEWEGELSDSDEMCNLSFKSPEELSAMAYSLFPAFKGGLDVMDRFLIEQK